MDIKTTSLKELNAFWKFEKEALNGSSIQKRSYKLYNTPITNFTIDDIRFMIGQEIGLKHLIPISIDYLREDILTEGMYYPGDLLKMVLTIHTSFWKNHQQEKKDLQSLIKKSELNVNLLNLDESSKTKFREIINDFLSL
jgi:hypothetical protein